MTEEILDQMRRAPGLYVFGDSEIPNATFPVSVVKGPLDSTGRIFALEVSYEVKATEQAFRPTTFLAGGPYSVQQIEANAEKEHVQAGMEMEADYFRDIALRAEKHLRFARTLQAPKSAGFIEATDLIERLENYRRSRAILEHSEQMVEQQKPKESLWEGPPPMWGNPEAWNTEPPKA